MAGRASHLFIAAGVDAARVDVESHDKLVGNTVYLDGVDLEQGILSVGESRHGYSGKRCGGYYAGYGVRFHCQNV